MGAMDGGSQALLTALFGGASSLQGDFEAMAAMLAGASRVLVTSHESPDGDAISSTLAVCHVLWAMGKEAVPFNVDPVPHNFTFLPGAARLRRSLDPAESFDVTVVVDCGERHRMGASFPANGWGRQVVVLDHHRTWDAGFPELCVRDPTAAAVGEMVFRLALTVGVATSPELARCCYASLMSDTGSFRYSSTSPTTFRIASHLLTCGVEPWEMTSNIYENDPVERIRLLGRVLETLAVSPCGRLAFLRVDLAMLEGLDNGADLLDGFINYGRRIRGVEVATQLREVGPEAWRVSFRSRGAVNVSELASRFGGGGHHNAAACVMQGAASEIQRSLTEALDAILGGAEA